MGLMRTAGRAAVASSVHGRVQRRQQQAWAQQEAAASAQPQPPVATPPPPAQAPGAGPDMARRIEQLTQLGELRDAGVLTAEEFETQKAQILAG